MFMSSGSLSRHLVAISSWSSVQFCLWFQCFVGEHSQIWDITWFHLSAYISFQNTHIRTKRNPHEIMQRLCIWRKSGCCVALSLRQIISPIFFELNCCHQGLLGNIQWICTSVNKWCTKGRLFPTCHTSNASMREIERFFGGQVITKNLWPPRPPDFWGLQKGQYTTVRQAQLMPSKKQYGSRLLHYSCHICTCIQKFPELGTKVLGCCWRGHCQHHLKEELSKKQGKCMNFS